MDKQFYKMTIHEKINVRSYFEIQAISNEEKVFIHTYYRNHMVTLPMETYSCPLWHGTVQQLIQRTSGIYH
jgi:hypothetical protein